MAKSIPSISSAARRLGVAIGGAALLAGMLVLLPRASSAAASGSSPALSSGWVASWAASPMAASNIVSSTAYAEFSNQTVRNVIYTSVGGDELQVQLSNTFGATALTVGAVSVGVVL